MAKAIGLSALTGAIVGALAAAAWGYHEMARSTDMRLMFGYGSLYIDAIVGAILAAPVAGVIGFVAFGWLRARGRY